ncbi:hypothetical protein A5641_04040 [Mycobacterium sp. 1554424.7]|nr:hypothetical protein A5641_04040 [Mycobacterium sp. 1554424.7]
MGSVRQIVSLGQPAQQAAARAPVEGTSAGQSAGDVGGAAAGVGAETGQRAPFEVAAPDIDEGPAHQGDRGA